jgi:type IV pilus assembly protein PilQ
VKKYKILKIIIGLLFFSLSWQLSAQQDRFTLLRSKLDSIVAEAPGLRQKAEINVNNVALSDFLQALASSHNINVNIHPELSQISISNNFSNATVLDVLVFVCKEFDLDIDFTGNILSIHKVEHKIPKPVHRTIPISYDASSGRLSIDLQNDTLYVAFKQLMDKTGKNLVFAPGMGKLLLSGYIQNMPFDSALDKIAFSNNLVLTKTRDHYYLFEQNSISNEKIPVNTTPTQQPQQAQQRPTHQRRSTFFFEIDSVNHNLNVDFENVAIATIIYDIGHALDKNMFTSMPLDEAGTASVKANHIEYDLLLDKILENTNFAYKKVDSIYYFGKAAQISLRDAVVIPLMHRSIEVMTSNSNSGRRAGRNTFNSTPNSFGSNFNNGVTAQGITNNRQRINTPNTATFSERTNQLESLLTMLPEDVIKDLKVSVDIELNSFIVSGPSQHIERFKKFIAYIDKPVPVILIEVMLLEVNKTATVETGISWGIGKEPATTQGNIYPTTDLTLGATTVNRIIGGFNGFGSWNLGQVVPNFFAKIKAMETNGDIKIRSAPKLSALNGHRANLSIGETTYYAVTQRDIIGSQNPQTSTITNFYPIDAEFAISIKPLVSGDGQITLEINVIQSNFNGKQVAENAPPGVNSREFNSIIRVKDQDMVILGGLEEKIKNDTGSGVPLLARIPIIKWLFSNRKREDTKKKLTVLIKPTIIK